MEPHNTFSDYTAHDKALLVYSEADLGLLQHPRWSAL